MRTRKLSPKTQTHNKLSVFLNTGSIRSDQRGLDSFYSLKALLAAQTVKRKSVLSEILPETCNGLSVKWNSNTGASPELLHWLPLDSEVSELHH